MGEDAGNQGRENAGVDAGRHRHGVVGVLPVLRQFFAEAVLQVRDLRKGLPVFVLGVGEGRAAAAEGVAHMDAGPLIVKGHVGTQAGDNVLLRVGVKIGEDAHLHVVQLLHHRQVPFQGGHLVHIADLGHVRVLVPEAHVPVGLQTFHHGIAENVRIGRGHGGRAVDFLLHAVQVCGRAVIPAAAVKDADKRALFQRGLVLLQNAVLKADGGAVNRFIADVGKQPGGKFHKDTSLFFVQHSTVPRETQETVSCFLR